jgi:uncharacterized protein
LRRPLRIAHATDIHVGWTTPSRVLERAARTIHDARPDVVVLTGDYVNVSQVHLARVRRFVEMLPRPVVATLGNHDHWAGAAAIARALTAAGAKVLRNEAMTVGDLTIVGVDDARSGNDDVDRAFHGVDRPEDALVLQHAPTGTHSIAKRRGRMVLSGHTHGGQIVVGKVTSRIARAVGEPYLSGWFDIGPTKLYVNAGLGHAPLRRGKTAHAEVAIFDLVPSAPTE